MLDLNLISYIEMQGHINLSREKHSKHRSDIIMDMNLLRELV